MTTVSAWGRLTTSMKANGCMSMVPGSHAWGNNIEFLHTLRISKRCPRSSRTQARGQARPREEGEVHYHHGLTCTARTPTRAAARACDRVHYMTERTITSQRQTSDEPLIEVGDGKRLEAITSRWRGTAAGRCFPRKSSVACAESLIVCHWRLGFRR